MLNAEISDTVSKYDARGIMLILEQLSKQGYRAYQPINIAYGIRNSTVARIEEGKLDIPGVSVSIEPVRYYPMGETAAHILGYMGKISQPFELKKYIDELGYSPNDIIGKIGVEQNFEEYLNGVDGTRQVEVDVMGNTIKVLDEQKAIPGNNLYLTIDAKLQKIAEDSLKKALEQIQKGGEFESEWGNYNYSKTFKNATSGSVVAIDVKTGELLAMANYPAYDPNLFATGISTADYDSLKPEHEEDPLAPRPLYNIALQTAVQPGSTFKMITGLAALEKGLSPTKEIYDAGYVEIGGQRFGCWLWNDSKRLHGWENLYDAIRDSCNYYFYSLTLGRNVRTGQEIGVRITIDDILKTASNFGLNDKTGVEIPGEKSGGVPDPNVKVNNTKRSLRTYLNKNIKNFIMENEKLTNKEIEKAKDEIVSWVGQEETLTRNEVIRRLNSLKIDGERKVEGQKVNMVDMIKYTYLNQSGWQQGDTLNISIGQGQNAYTPIQMANYIAILANGGYKYRVTTIDKVESYDGDKVVFKPEREVERIELNNYDNLKHVGEGMALVTAPGGTSHSAFRNFPIQVAAKTGTAQNQARNPVTGEEYDNFAWYVAYAPYDDPQIAIAAVIFQGGSGGYAAPVVKEIVAQYMGLNDTGEDIHSMTNNLAK